MNKCNEFFNFVVLLSYAQIQCYSELTIFHTARHLIWTGTQTLIVADGETQMGGGTSTVVKPARTPRITSSQFYS